MLATSRASDDAQQENKTHNVNIAGAKGNQGDKGEKGLDGKSGVKYVRWGKTTCPSGAEIVYKGMDKSMCKFKQILL